MCMRLDWEQYHPPQKSFGFYCTQQKSDLIPGVIMTIWPARVCVQLLEGSKFLMKNELRFKTFLLSTHFPVLPCTEMLTWEVGFLEQVARRVMVWELSPVQCPEHMDTHGHPQLFPHHWLHRASSLLGNLSSEILYQTAQNQQQTAGDKHVCLLCGALWFIFILKFIYVSTFMCNVVAQKTKQGPLSPCGILEVLLCCLSAVGSGQCLMRCLCACHRFAPQDLMWLRGPRATLVWRAGGPQFPAQNSKYCAALLLSACLRQHAQSWGSPEETLKMLWSKFVFN